VHKQLNSLPAMITSCKSIPVQQTSHRHIRSWRIPGENSREAGSGSDWPLCPLSSGLTASPSLARFGCALLPLCRRHSSYRDYLRYRSPVKAALGVMTAVLAAVVSRRTRNGLAVADHDHALMGSRPVPDYIPVCILMGRVQACCVIRCVGAAGRCPAVVPVTDFSSLVAGPTGPGRTGSSGLVTPSGAHVRTRKFQKDAKGRRPREDSRYYRKPIRPTLQPCTG
jgi:hypothetical protein